MLALVYLYFNVNEYLVPAFKMKKPEEAHLMELFTGEYAPPFLVCHFNFHVHAHSHIAFQEREATIACICCRLYWWSLVPGLKDT